MDEFTLLPPRFSDDQLQRAKHGDRLAEQELWDLAQVSFKKGNVDSLPLGVIEYFAQKFYECYRDKKSPQKLSSVYLPVGHRGRAGLDAALINDDRDQLLDMLIEGMKGCSVYLMHHIPSIHYLEENKLQFYNAYFFEIFSNRLYWVYGGRYEELKLNKKNFGELLSKYNVHPVETCLLQDFLSQEEIDDFWQLIAENHGHPKKQLNDELILGFAEEIYADHGVQGMSKTNLRRILKPQRF